MGYLGSEDLRIWGLKLSCVMFRKLYVLRVTEITFYVSGYGARKYSGDSNFLKKVF